MSTTAGLVAQAAIRELAALIDGPRRLRWFWRDELEAMQTATRRRGYPDEHPAAVYRCYHPTQEWIDHPTTGDVRGRAWTYQPPAADTPPGSEVRRVLITGSRTWTDASTIHAALAQVWGDGTAVLVSGACPRGADRIAETCWTRWGGRMQRHRADWQAHGRAAGFRRNAEMVAAGADVCLAFIHHGSPGATHTARLAEAAGIPTHRHTTDTSEG